MVYIMLCGRRPFERIDIPNQPEASEASLISSILLGRYHFNHAPFRDVSDEAIHFICTCFEPFRDRRMSAQELMNHPWITNENDRACHLSDLSPSLMYLKSEKSISKDISVGNVQSQANYANRTSFVRASMLGVAFSIPPSKTRMLRSIFTELDTDNTGYLDRSEFLEAVKKSSNLNESKTDEAFSLSGDVNILFDMIDLDGNNQISFLEFVAATIDPRSVDIQDLNQVLIFLSFCFGSLCKKLL